MALLSSGIHLFTFGMYRNRSMREIADEHPSYVVWAYEKVTSEPNGGVPHAIYERARANLRKAQRAPRPSRRQREYEGVDWDEEDVYSRLYDDCPDPWGR
jgi:hypothetical protein